MQFGFSTLPKIVIAVLAFAITSSAQPPAAGTLIDGAAHPEQIPESLAFRMFYRFLAQPANPTPEQIDRQQALVAPANLSEKDLQQLASVMADYYVGLENLRREVRIAKEASPNGLDAATAQRLTAERDSIVDEATSKLEALCPSNRLRLSRVQWINDQQHHIRVFFCRGQHEWRLSAVDPAHLYCRIYHFSSGRIWTFISSML